MIVKHFHGTVHTDPDQTSSNGFRPVENGFSCVKVWKCEKEQGEKKQKYENYVNRELWIMRVNFQICTAFLFL